MKLEDHAFPEIRNIKLLYHRSFANQASRIQRNKNTTIIAIPLDWNIIVVVSVELPVTFVKTVISLL